MQTGAAAGLIKFLLVYMAKALNFSATQIGITVVVGSVANFAGGIFWGSFADRTGKYKWTMLSTNALSVVLACCFTLKIIAENFFVFLFDFVLYAFFGSCWGTLVDAVAVIGKSQGGGSYGKLRLWAAVGWGTMAVLTGWLIDVTEIRVIFVTFTCGMALSSVIVAVYFSDPSLEKHEAGTEVIGDGTAKEVPHDSSDLNLRGILCKTEVFLLLLNLFIQGVLVAFVETYLYVYLAKVYKVPGFFMGLCTCVAAAFECPVFYYSEELIRKFGVKGLLTIAQFLYAGRVYLYTIIPNNSTFTGYWLFLFTEPLHALVFAAMWSAAVEYSRIIAPPQHQGTMQALVRGTYYFVGNGVGSILGGLIIDYKGGGENGYHLMYRFGGVAMGLWSVTWHFLMFIDSRCRPEGKKATDGSALVSVDSAILSPLVVVGR